MAIGCSDLICSWSCLALVHNCLSIAKCEPCWLLQTGSAADGSGWLSMLLGSEHRFKLHCPFGEQGISVYTLQAQ